MRQLCRLFVIFLRLRYGNRFREFRELHTVNAAYRPAYRGSLLRDQLSLVAVLLVGLFPLIIKLSTRLPAHRGFPNPHRAFIDIAAFVVPQLESASEFNGVLIDA